MFIVDLAGTHYNMGYQHGVKLARYREALLGLINEYREMIRSFSPGKVRQILQEIRSVLHTHSPQTLDMLRGIADGFGVSPEDLLGVRIRGYIEDRLAGISGTADQDECTAWAVSRSKAGPERTLIAKNRDYLLSNREWQAIFRCQPESGYAYFSLNSIGACNAPSCGMNEKGLAIVDTRVPSTDIGPGLPRFTLMMQILEQCKCVREAADFLKTVPRMGGGNVVFGDAGGGIGKAEAGFENLEVLVRESGLVVCTNHFEMALTKASYRKRDDEREADSKWRYETAGRELSKTEDGIDIPFALSLMAFHGDPYSICRHGNPEKPNRTATISSAVFVPGRRGFYYCQGFPCTAPFHWISF
jgi:isopenicillin-N N-acyltransferase-like protein